MRFPSRVCARLHVFRNSVVRCNRSGETPRDVGTFSQNLFTFFTKILVKEFC